MTARSGFFSVRPRGGNEKRCPQKPTYKWWGKEGRRPLNEVVSVVPTAGGREPLQKIEKKGPKANLKRLSNHKPGLGRKKGNESVLRKRKKKKKPTELPIRGALVKKSPPCGGGKKGGRYWARGAKTAFGEKFLCSCWGPEATKKGGAVEGREGIRS